jgi:hypothetical protein
LPDGGGVSGEHKEGGLESVFGVMVMAEDMATDRPHQPTVPLHQAGKGRRVALHRETLEQLSVGVAIAGAAAEGSVQDTELSQDRVELSGGHGSSLQARQAR